MLNEEFNENFNVLKSIKETKERRVLDMMWNILDSPLLDYTNFFRGTLPPENLDFKKYIESRMTALSNPIAVEFGGPGYNLFSGFTPGTFTKTVGVCLDQYYKQGIKEAQKDDPKKFPPLQNHNILIGNILDNKTYTELTDKLGGAKPNLIFSKMEGGLELGLPQKDKEKIALMLFKKWYRLLAEEGEMFVQYITGYFSMWPAEFGKQHETKPAYDGGYELATRQEAGLLIKYITDKYPAIQAKEDRGAIRLRKLPGAPKKLEIP